MEKYFLAIDIGASGGRHILGYMEEGAIKLEEIHRFPNGMVKTERGLIWDIDALFQEILAGMKKCKALGKIPESVGIDTWAVDFVLLDENDRRLGDAMAYRDSGNRHMDEKVYEIISEERLYERTGIQKQIFNTIYQLMGWKETRQNLWEKAGSLLMIPDYFHFLLSGIKATEYTNATTTQLVSPITKNWDTELMEQLDFPISLFSDIVMPGTLLGELTEEIQKQVGYNCKVVLPATHDTASAVMAVPVQGNRKALYISSGTWSLMGTELSEANCSTESKKANLTNEGGYDYRFRFLKNIMGLWMIQSVQREIGQDYSFARISEMAAEASITSIIDVNAERFLAPENMTEEIREACKEQGLPVPRDLGEVAAVIYNSLADSYGRTVEEIEQIMGTQFDAIHIVGGGSNAKYLNQVTALSTAKSVYAGPTEATAIGNLAAQMIAAGELKDLQDARTCIYQSFEICTFTNC